MKNKVPLELPRPSANANPSRVGGWSRKAKRQRPLTVEGVCFVCHSLNVLFRF
jgi:hypothetical protein